MLIQNYAETQAPDPSQMLTTETRDYKPSAYRSFYHQYLRNPPFSLNYVQSMCADPHIALGLQLLKGPIMSKARFYVDCDNASVKDFIKVNLSRFWRNSAFRALSCVDWGFAPHEVLYREEGGQFVFRTLADGLRPLDCRLVTDNGYYVGFSVRNIVGKEKEYVLGPKGFWPLHDRHISPYYGRSRLYYAYLPWFEMWGEGGYRQSRKLFYYKASHLGPRIYYPPGSTPIATNPSGAPGGPAGIYVNNKDLARELIEKYRAGASLTLPSVFDDRGNPMWRIEDPQTMPIPDALENWGEILRREQWEGLGILSEMAEAEGTGAYAGRQVPQEAFFSILQAISNDLVSDFDEQVLRYLVLVNFGQVEYEIVPFRLLREEDQQDQEQGLFANGPPSDAQDGRQPLSKAA